MEKCIIKLYNNKMCIRDRGVYDQLKAAGIRTELDRKDEKVGYKIRQAQLENCLLYTSRCV